MEVDTEEMHFWGKNALHSELLHIWQKNRDGWQNIC